MPDASAIPLSATTSTPMVPVAASHDAAAPTTAADGRVQVQASTIRPATPQFTEASRQKLADFGAAKLRLHARSCEATIDAALHADNGPQLRKLGHARITRVQVSGDSAEVSVHGVGGRTRVVKGDGGWLIDSQPNGETD